MAGHNLQVTIKSGNQIDAITVSERGVEVLMPGPPAETVEQAKTLFVTALIALLNSKGDDIKEAFKNDNVTIST